MEVKINIAIVDDEAPNRKLLERSLGYKYNVASYASGEACLEGIDDFSADIFLLDVRMPNGMDGFELCRKLREEYKYEQYPIFFISALDSLDQKQKGYEAGADDYIAKPILLKELEALIEKAVIRIKSFRGENENENSKDVIG